MGREPAPFDRVDAIVTLAGGTGRMERGLDLLLEDRARILLLSGTHRDARLEDIFPDRNLSEVPAESVILLENRSTSTYENALEARAVLFTRERVHSIALITSNYHVRRAEFVFEEVFPSDVTIYVVPVRDPSTEPGTWWRTGRGRKLVLTEFFKWCVYWLRF